ncbi:MAG: chitobiase/beta-hexosaminidase C-terminal domain-containing protein, partial [Bacteroidales bacterium]|nr:chitobiase/beta-hexosaminidase C-terminal domain-containing protein [Bacteroidales bacterium]
MMFANRQKKKALALRTFAVAMFLALFTQFAQAQNNVYMHTGSRTLVGNETVKFYDSGGESSGPAYYWERWFSRNEDYTFTFKPESGKKIKATFKQFTAYTDNNGASAAHTFTTHENWSLRLNTAELSIYDGLTTDAENLISTYTGSVINEFTVIADGAMTFHFQSYGYREEGWYAEVEQVDTYSVQKPSISFEVCSDDVVLNANNKDATIYYTTDGNAPVVADPLTGATLYEGPFHVVLNTTVKAIAVMDGTASAVASLRYTKNDVTPTPGLATVTREGNTIIMTPAPLEEDINETYQVWYKIGEEGALQLYTEPFEWSTPRTNFYVFTRAQSCSDKMSPAAILVFDKVQVPDPTITFEVTNTTTGEGTVEINCPSGYVLSYTTNGSDPEPNTSANTNSVTLTNVAPGTTIKAIAFKITNDALDPDYQESDIVTLLCLPGGEGESGTYGGIVILDDREDHSWSYYSDASVDKLHKLKPIDVKITYYGNGQDENNMTSNDAKDIPTEYGAKATGVQVNVNEPGNQFVYLKTLEAANADGSGNYPYTMIPNPFQVRPMYSPTKGEDEDKGNFVNPSISNVVRDSNGNIVAKAAGTNATKTRTANVAQQGTMNRGMTASSDRSIMSMRGLTPVTSLTVGNTYVIAKGNYAMGNTTYGSSGGLYSVSFNSSDSPSNTILWTIESGNATNGYIFKNVDNNKYLGLNTNWYLDVVDTGTAMTYDGTDLKNNDDPDGYYYVALSDNTAYFTTSTGSNQEIVIYEYTPDAGTTVWVETTTITPNEEYLIGFEYDGNVYLAVNYYTGGSENTCYYTNSNSTYYGYTALAAIDGNGYVTGVSGYASDLKYCTWKFSTTSGGTITSGYESGRYLYGWTSSTSYNDLYPSTSSTTWTYNSSTGILVANSSYYADYYSLSNQPHMRVTSDPSATVRLYSKQTVAVPCTVTAHAGSNISTAYVAEGSSFSGTNTSVTVLSGSDVTFQATVNSNCAFSGWYNGTQLVSTANPYTCVVSGDLTLTAKAVPTYTVTADAGTGISTAYVAEGGTFSGTATSVTVAQGGSATFQATAANGYVFDGWYDQSNQLVNANTTFTITNVQGNTTLTAKGTTSYNITVNVTGGGTVTASPNPATAGQTITLTINANSGYNLTSITAINNATGDQITLSGSGNTRTFTMPASTVTVNAVFVDPTDVYRGFYAWRVKRLSSGLSITDSNNNTYGEGATIYADQEIQFVAEGNSTDNEVEFEALWAKA